MTLSKQILLNLYYHATRPARARRFRRAAAEGRMPVLAFYWHRIADDRANPWTLSHAMFVRQIRWLQKRFSFISLTEAQQRIRSGRNDRPCVCVTFDDGYADNCRTAIPFLIQEKIPCTYFVTARNVFEGEPFPYDATGGRPAAPNTVQQLRAMARAGIEIGAHTDTHPNLGAIADPERLRAEVVAPKAKLEAAVDRPVRYFAFPFGLYANLNRQAFALAREAGYSGVCSAYGGYNFPGDDPFHLQRIPADETMIRLKNWATMDPRKLRTRRFTE